MDATHPSGNDDEFAFTKTTSPSENFDTRVPRIGNGPSAGCASTVSWDGTNGTMKALLSCTDVDSPDARLIAVYTPDNTIIIDDNTEGLEANFLVEGLGLWIDSDGTGEPTHFSGAPVRTTIQTF